MSAITVQSVHVYRVAHGQQSRRYFGKRAALRWLAVHQADSKPRWHEKGYQGVFWAGMPEFQPVLLRFFRRYTPWLEKLP